MIENLEIILLASLKIATWLSVVIVLVMFAFAFEKHCLRKHEELKKQNKLPKNMTNLIIERKNRQFFNDIQEYRNDFK